MTNFFDLQNDIITYMHFSSDVSFYITCVIYGIIFSVIGFGVLYYFGLLFSNIFCSKHYLFILSSSVEDNSLLENYRCYTDKELYNQLFYTIRVGLFTKIMFNSVVKQYSKQGLLVVKVLKFNSKFCYDQFVFGSGNFLDYKVVYSEFDK